MSEDRMAFPNTWEEFEKEYGFTDTDEIYTNGSRLIQSFRVKQWLEHLDAVPVIRCKDCKYWSKDKRMGEVGRCFGREHQWAMHGDGYCSDAVRKDDETD